MIISFSSCRAFSQTTIPEKTVVLLYNKPPGVTTTHATNDPLGRLNVYEDVMSMKGYEGPQKTLARGDFAATTGIRSKLHAIGRLDADTSGLLLLTNDGALVHHVTNKKASTAVDQGIVISKTYQALIMGHHDETSQVLEELRNKGVDIGEKYGGMTQPVKELFIISHPSKTSTLLNLTLEEGKNRQIRRMFHLLGSGVMKLKRIRVGEYLTLDDLNEGQWRILSNDEVKRSLNWTSRVINAEERRRPAKPKRRKRAR
jgi:pseudouridine synthase